MKSLKLILCSAALLLLAASGVRASGESDLAIPDLNHGHYDKLWNATPWQVLFFGALVILGTLSISLYQLYEIRKYPAHKSMLDVAEIIFQTCKTYLIQQGKFLLMLFVLIAQPDVVLLPRPAAKVGRNHGDRPALLRRRHGRLLRGGLVRHPRQHLRQLPAPPSPRCAASRGTWSTSRCGPACRSACS